MTEIAPETRAMIERLIAFDTTSWKSNLALIEDVEAYLAEHGIEATLVRDETGQKANLYATIGPTDRGGIALSGHTDVVPVDGQDWASDPFAAEEREGKLYGRGSCDMKSFIAAVLARVPKMIAAPLETPLHICLSHDEEVGCLGVPSLLEHLKRQPVMPKMAIIGEPTDMKVVNAHKGKMSVRCRVRGSAGHSSLAPRHVNAVHEAAKVVALLDEMARRKQTEGPFDDQFDVPHTTIHTGVLVGGTALNIVPEDCRFEFEFRYLPEDDPEALLEEVTRYAKEELEPAMKEKRPETGFAFDANNGIAALDTPEDHEIVTLVKNLAQANSTTKVAFGTEAGLFQRHDMAAVVCGPGSIDQAHKADEFVSLEQVALCEAFLDRLIDHARA